MSSLKIPIFQVKQNDWIMYVGAIKAKDLFELASADRIRLETVEIPKYAGFQRPLVESRVREIRNYLTTPKSTFPNSIIVSIDSDYIKNWNKNTSENELSCIEIECNPNVLKIIDGQHRVAALDSAPDHFQVILTIFVDLDIVNSAEIFSKINSTQKAVNPSIAFQLFGYSSNRSPQKTAHDIATILNETDGSPFFKKLRMLGIMDSWSKGTLSQSTFAKHLMSLYTKNFLDDECKLLKKEKLEEYSNYPLRKYFILEDEKTILNIIWRFFYNVASTWPNQWNDSKGESILTKTTGYSAFIDVLKKWMLSNRSNQILKDEGVKEAFDKIKENYTKSDAKFIRTNYPSGNQGVVILKKRIIEDLKL